MFNNIFNPYSYYTREGLFSILKNRINWSGILNTTQKTLNIANQAIPLMYQVRPIINNAKTVFKVMGAIKEDTPTQKQQNPPSTIHRKTINSTNKENANINIKQSQNQPIFFL